MGNLPKSRVKESPAFDHTGVNFFVELLRDLVFPATGMEGSDEFLDDVGVLMLTRQKLQIVILSL